MRTDSRKRCRASSTSRAAPLRPAVLRALDELKTLLAAPAGRGYVIENGTPSRIIECRPSASSPCGREDSRGSAADSKSLSVKARSSCSAADPTGRRQQVDPHDRDDQDGGSGNGELGRCVHGGDPPRRPARPTLRGRVQHEEHVVEDTVRGLVLVRAQPRPDDARNVLFGMQSAHLPGRRPQVGIERRSQRTHRVMKTRVGRPGRDAADVGNPLERQVEVVVQDHDRSMVE